MRAQPRFRGQRGVHRRALEADEIDVAFVDGKRERVVLHSRASSQISEHNDCGSHDAFISPCWWPAPLFGLLLTPLVTSASLALGLVDAPGGRKVHSTAVPRVGGLAIVLRRGPGALSSIAGGAWTRWAPSSRASARSSPMLAGAALVFAVGLVDDLTSPAGVAQARGSGRWPRPLWHGSGLLIERLTIGGADAGSSGCWPSQSRSLWIVGLTNAFNLIDGIDGLAAGIAVIAGTTCARHSDRPRPRGRGDAAGGAGRRGARVSGLQLRSGLDLSRRRRQPGRSASCWRRRRSPAGRRARPRSPPACRC